MSIEKNVSETGLPVELPKTGQTSNPSDLRDNENIPMNTSKNKVGPRPEVNVTKKQNDLPVETIAVTLAENRTEKQNDLPVETVADTMAGDITGKPSMDVGTTSQDLMDMEPGNNLTTYSLNGSSVENNKNKHKTDAITEMNMLGSENESNNALLEKYDNNKILPVDTAWQVDYGLDPNTDVPTAPDNKKTPLDTNNNDNVNSSYDSDDTILLEQEIAEAIGDQASKLENNELPVETETTSDTNTITNQLANVRINNSNDLPVETANIPTSPNKGKVVIKSYRLRRGVTKDTESTETTTTDQDNTENEALHLNIPSGNATRPPPPNKYKIRKFQIDKVRYYSCTYCNKHFESIHYLNNHHRKRHPPVTYSTTCRIH